MSNIQAFGIAKSIYDGLPTKDCWIAGGAMRSWLVGERVKDIDIFSAEPEKRIRLLRIMKSISLDLKTNLLLIFTRAIFVIRAFATMLFRHAQKQ